MANEESAELTEPGVGAFDDPAALISSEFSSVLVSPVLAVFAIRDDQVSTAFFESFAQRIGVVGAVGDYAFGLCRGRPLGRGTLTSASVASASVTSPGEALSSRTPSGRPSPSTSTIHFVPLPRLVLPTAEPPFSLERSCRPGTSLPTSADLRHRAHPVAFARHRAADRALPERSAGACCIDSPCAADDLRTNRTSGCGASRDGL